MHVHVNKPSSPQNKPYNKIIRFLAVKRLRMRGSFCWCDLAVKLPRVQPSNTYGVAYEHSGENNARFSLATTFFLCDLKIFYKGKFRLLHCIVHTHLTSTQGVFAWLKVYNSKTEKIGSIANRRILVHTRACCRLQGHERWMGDAFQSLVTSKNPDDGTLINFLVNFCVVEWASRPDECVIAFPFIKKTTSKSWL